MKINYFYAHKLIKIFVETNAGIFQSKYLHLHDYAMV